ncbi:sodium/glucose cotransporter 4-like isoform X1 [Biomphalaria glabrata]|uniref:Sodium/glucose cotransporter 4-like isoform X1 n=2 Tax=Biomphalaria glabrata TaxID=6526 RepID=A0A9W3BFB7_BIOGL|nr:sodium/glucose cotransporter 4-like isoform X1 [Biomphalaria glabrata]XP_055898129.1 sodium/glucose cotransporter 4-like isoform X1 [Biomphalaria glabrata]XP_055898130.1 sodium/glucose cotransporter 4-like isoform X1 [Biomphalaria glabrata]XP_055898131.1 sodium/glucose cotransporter 4-like isoform X1 [Biomphalaria glabrata]
MNSAPGLDHWADILIVILYFIAVLIVGLWSLCRPNRGSIKSYFLAGRDLSWWPVGASLFSSNIGSEHFVGLAGTGAAAGIAMVFYEWNSMFLVVVLAWFFLPVYVSAGVYTLPEFMAKRFGGARLRIYLSCLSLVLYIVTKLAVSIYAGGLFIKLALGWDMYISIAGLLLITGIYTVMGGLAAVIYTDTFQTFIMTVGAVVLSVISFNKIGGYKQLVHRYMMAVPSVTTNVTSSCGRPREDAFHLFRDPVNSDNPWPGILLQSSIGCMWYWCCDQVIVQRSLAAKNLSHAKGGSLLAGYLKLTPLFFMVFPGMISRALYPDVIACVDPVKCQEYCENPVGCSNVAYPKLVLELMPVGLRGLLMAVMLSAIMSSLTSIFNSSATLFTMDLWRRVRNHASERELLIVGRLFILLLCGVAILWIPMVKSSQGGQLFNYIQAVQGYLGTPIGALFLAAILWKRMNERGAFFGLLSGHAAGVIRMVIDFAYPAPQCGEVDTRPVILSAVHYTYFGSINLIITALAIVIFSYTAPAQDEEQLYAVTWWTRVDRKSQTNRHTDLTLQEDDTLSESSQQTPTTEAGISRWQRWFNFACGIPSSTAKIKEAPEISIAQRRSFLLETSKWRGFLNINATIGLVVMAFLIGYFH